MEIVDDKEYREFRIALEFLFRVRSALHLVSKKKEDKLRLDLIPVVSVLLKYEQSKEGQMKFARKVTESLKGHSTLQHHLAQQTYTGIHHR